MATVFIHLVSIENNTANFLKNFLKRYKNINEMLTVQKSN